MKSLTIRFSAILMMLGVFAVASFGQKTERVKFAAGETSGSYSQTIAANGSIDFMINANAGQYMDYTVAYDFTKTDIQAFLTEPKAQDISQTATIDARNVFKIKTGGDHRLTVNNVSRKSVTITLYLSIFDNDPDVDVADSNSVNNDVERIKFAKGSIEVNLEKTVPANGAKRFVFWAKAGQEIGVTVTPKNKNAKLDIELSGKKVTSGKLYTMIAPKTGDYLLDILNADDKNQPFTLDLGIGESSDTPTETTENSGGETVKFADNSAALTRDISANGSYDFIINAKKGQKLSIQMGYEGRASDIQAFLSEPGLQDISLSLGAETRKEFVVKANGDHRLTVTNKTGKKITFTLYVDVE